MGAVVCVPMLILKYIFGLMRVEWFQWAEFFLALPILAIVGARIHAFGWVAIRRQRRLDWFATLLFFSILSTAAAILTLAGMFPNKPLLIMEIVAVLTATSAYNAVKQTQK